MNKDKILLRSELKQMLEEAFKEATEITYDKYGFPSHPPIEDVALYVLKHLMERLEDGE